MGQVSSCCVEDSSTRSKRRPQHPHHNRHNKADLIASYHTSNRINKTRRHSITSPHHANAASYSSSSSPHRNHLLPHDYNKNDDSISITDGIQQPYPDAKCDQNKKIESEFQPSSVPNQSLLNKNNTFPIPPVSPQTNNNNNNYTLSEFQFDQARNNSNNNNIINNDLLNLMSTSDESQIQRELYKCHLNKKINMLDLSENENNISTNPNPRNLLPKNNDNNTDVDGDSDGNKQYFQANMLVLESSMLSFANSSMNSQNPQQQQNLRSEYFNALEPLLVTSTPKFSAHYYSHLYTNNNTNNNANAQKRSGLVSRIQLELQEIKQQASALIDERETGSVFISYCADRIQFMQFLFLGGASTPFAHGAYIFDVFIPDDYPHSPPRLHFVQQASSQYQSAIKKKYRFSPKLLPDGRVALTILGISNSQSAAAKSKQNLRITSSNTTIATPTASAGSLSHMVNSNTNSNSTSSSRVTCASCRFGNIGEMITSAGSVTNINNTNTNNNNNINNVTSSSSSMSNGQSARTSLLCDVIRAIKKEIFCQDIITNENEETTTEDSLYDFSEGFDPNNDSTQLKNPVHEDVVYCNTCKNMLNPQQVQQIQLQHSPMTPQGESSCRNSTATTSASSGSKHFLKRQFSSNNCNSNSSSLNLNQMYARGYRDVVQYANVAHAIIDVLAACAFGKPTVSLQCTRTQSVPKSTSENELADKGIFAAFKPILEKHFTLESKSIIKTINAWIAEDKTTRGPRKNEQNKNYYFDAEADDGGEEAEYHDSMHDSSINLDKPLYTGIVSQHNREIAKMLESKSLARALSDLLSKLKPALKDLTQ